MLQLRPSCEHCQIRLPPDATHAMICSFECTFCATCVDLLDNVCPNCGGGFSPRPIRPAGNHRNSNCLAKYPASAAPVHKTVDLDKHGRFADPIREIPPEQR